MSIPQKITVHSSEQILEICWNDGLISRFPLMSLRKACPCVVCRGGHENMGAPVDPEVFKTVWTQQIGVANMKPMGTYAVQITWSDGHNSGIYRWDKLRDWSTHLVQENAE